MEQENIFGFCRGCEGGRCGKDDMSREKDIQQTRDRLTRKYDGRKNVWFVFVQGLVIVGILLFLVFRFIFGVSTVDGKSMHPTLKNGQRLVFFRLMPSYERGDVICMRMPNGDQYVKRVIAKEGDTVEIVDGCIYVNGQELKESYAVGKTEMQEDTVEYPLKLEEEQYFVMGDNRENSIDSRSFGPIVVYQILGLILGDYGS